MHCPACAGGRGGWHLGYNLRTGVFACWRCGALRFWDVMPRLFRTDDAGVRRILGEQRRDPKAVPVPVGESRKRITERPQTLAAPPGAAPMMEAHRKYLRTRNFDPVALEQEWGLLGTNHLGGRWAWRIVFPVHNGADEMVAWQGRVIGDQDPKYKMTSDADCLEQPDLFLYGINKVPGDTVIIVEGATGVWRIGPGAVGTLGTSWKMAQANRLRRFKRRFILFDPEPNAQRRAVALARMLSLFRGETEIVSGYDTDPGDMSEDEVGELREELEL